MLRLGKAGIAAVDALAGGRAVGRSRGLQALARRLLDTGMAHPRPASTPWRAGDITLVVPVRDDAEGLAEMLAALCDAAGPDDRPGSIVVVDDGSEVAVAVGDGITLVRRERAGGPGAARNAGMAQVTTPLVAFVDADVVPAPGWIGPLLAHLADPQVVAAAPRVRSRAGPAAGAATAGGTAVAPAVLAGFEAVESPLDMGDREASVAPRGRVSYVPNAALLARSDAIAAAGGFDERLRYGEDVDLVWRLVEGGGTVRYEPRSLVYHRPRTNLAAWFAQRFHYGSAAAPLVSRHPGAAPPLAVSGWSLAAWGLVAARRPALGLGVAAASTALLVRKLSDLPSPGREAVRLAGAGHLAAGRWIARAITRAWWPLAVPAALLSRRARTALAAAALVPPLVDWWRTRPPLGPVRYVTLRLADDIAYGAGLWAGCWREGSAAALVPDLRSWPGRRALAS